MHRAAVQRFQGFEYGGTLPYAAPAQGVAQLVQKIFHKAQPKRFGNGFMNGPVLAGLVEAYVKAINEGAVPTIATAWQVRVGFGCVRLCFGCAFGCDLKTVRRTRRGRLQMEVLPQ